MLKKLKKKLGAKKFWGTVVVLAVLLCWSAIHYIPHELNRIIFQGFLSKMIYLIPAIPLGVILFINIKDVLNSKASGKQVLGILGGGIIFIAGAVFINFGTDYLTYLQYAKFGKQEELIRTDSRFIRYAALQSAGKDLSDNVRSDIEQIDESLVFPIMTPSCMGYTAPIQPEGFWPTWRNPNPGVIFYNDCLTGPDKTQRIDHPFLIGPGLQIEDNLKRNLYLTDWFATYEDPHLLVLDPEKPKNFTLAIPKIKYFLWRFPYWAGVVLVHGDGKIEDISVKKIKSDPRLKGQWLAPMSLARKYVELQNYAAGFWINVFNMKAEGRIELLKLPGTNQFPLLIRGVDKQVYFVVAVKAGGKGRGLYAMYFLNASTFEKSAHVFPKDKTVYGPTAALERVPNLPGYNWYRETATGSSGHMQAVEAVYIVDSKGDLWWKFAITNMDFSGTSGVVVVDGGDLDNMLAFGKKERDQFNAWLWDGDLAAKPLNTSEHKEEPSGNIELIKEAKEYLKRGLEILNRLQLLE